MRVALRFLAILCPVIALATYGSLKVMDKLEQQWVESDLSRRAALISESTHDYLVDNLRAKKPAAVQKLLNRISRDERLMGAVFCRSETEELARSQAVPSDIQCAAVSRILKTDRGKVISSGPHILHEAAFPLNDGNEQLGYLVLLHDTSYMVRRHETARSYIVMMLSALSVFFFFLTLAVYRWTISDSVHRFKQVFRGLLSGEVKTIDKSFTRSSLSPLAKDLSKVMRELRYAKSLAEDSKSGLAWTSSRLRESVQSFFGDKQLTVIANREPYVHNRKGNQIEVLLPASGLVSAVEPILRACSGLWIAHGSGTADRETADSTGKLLVPPENPEYALKRVWLTKAEEQGYYYGFSNEGLWPLCHIAHARPHFDASDYAAYNKVNEKFAEAFLAEQNEENPIALIQDYHFALLPQMIREKKPNAVLSLFWHIPWPNPEAFGICPWRKEILQGMLGADLIGFHTQFHCNNFLDTVDRFMEARVDREQFSVTIQGHVCHIKPFPISTIWPPKFEIPLEEFRSEREGLLAELNLPKLIQIGLGVDRVDYTKGIIERFRSIERLLERHPELIGKFVFIQVGAPSRTHIKRYKDLQSEVQEVADEINWKFHKAEVPPILLRLFHHNSPELQRYYRAADVCFVSSLHDGMNLVAKEYVSARADHKGALVLSTFTGAARELLDAFQVNPYDVEECAEALYRALHIQSEEAAHRMQQMRNVVAERNVYAWGGSLLAEVHRIEQQKKGILRAKEAQLL